MNEVNGEEEGEKGKMIGVVGIVREQEIGYKIDSDYWGMGFCCCVGGGHCGGEGGD